MKLRPDWQQLNRRLSRAARGGYAPRRRHALRPVTAQALVEFMLVSIPLLATMFGIFEFGLAFWDLAQIGQVARDAARETAACANQCDGPGDKSVAGGDAKYYKDIKALEAVVDKNPVQKNGTKLNPANIDYVLIRRVGDTTSDTGQDKFFINTVNGRYDISTQYQLYVNYLDPNGAPIAGRFLPFQDATAAQAQQLGLPDPSKAPDGSTIEFHNTNYMSSPCIGVPSAPAYSDVNDTNNKADNMDFTCRYQPDTDSRANDPNYNWARGRPVCQPAERLYVEIAYRHYWVTPFLPDVAGNTVIRPKDQNGNGYILIRQRSYITVEPRFFPVNGGVCPTGVS